MIKTICNKCHDHKKTAHKQWFAYARQVGGAGQTEDMGINVDLCDECLARLCFETLKIAIPDRLKRGAAIIKVLNIKI